MFKRFFFILIIILPITTWAAFMPVPNPPQISAKSYMLMDANSGKIIAQTNEYERLPPASLTKLMTLYITFRELANSQIHLDDKVHISKKAWKIEGSRMFLKVGSKVSVNDLIQGIAVVSGNDATTAIAEYIGGSESVFVQMMNQEAKSLGMKDTHFTDATGLPHPEHYSSAYDLALLTRALIRNFPQYYHYFKEKWFTWNDIKQPNRNRLLWRNLGVDGLKTGHTKEAGYCLIASAQEDHMRLISVVMKTDSDNARTNDSQTLLRYGFRFFSSEKIADANQKLDELRVWGGENKTIPVGLNKDVYVTIPRSNNKAIKTQLELNKSIKAPIQKGQVVGKLIATAHDKTLIEENVVALEDDPKGGLWRRFSDWIIGLF